jgi:ABC-type transport system involved in Fe-S cluster assembly fused permease/ATPase subunit
MRSSYFGPVFAAACLIAVLNFVWFIVVCRRWRLADGRTSLEAWRDANKRDRS